MIYYFFFCCLFWTFARLCHLVDETTNEMKDNINRIDNKLRRLEDASSKSKKLKNQANFIANKLELFDQTYFLLLSRMYYEPKDMILSVLLFDSSYVPHQLERHPLLFLRIT